MASCTSPGGTLKDMQHELLELDIVTQREDERRVQGLDWPKISQQIGDVCTETEIGEETVKVEVLIESWLLGHTKYRILSRGN